MFRIGLRLTQAPLQPPKLPGFLQERPRKTEAEAVGHVFLAVPPSPIKTLVDEARCNDSSQPIHPILLQP